MMRSNQRFAAAPVRKPRDRKLHARARKLVRAWSAQSCGLRADAAVQRRFERIIVQSSADAAQ
eukprot:8939267-Lingulodinium_polyedra.AAC.1